ncbi:type I-F CRISPR-associated helicase Cas3 [Pasteurella atlantica]|uniref:type I-F CRISPR-associated helicase Cas3f n=1 Tax=Pasteurella atlantica TaxID=2827233 RepID=UPI001B82FDB9|nr:type I-F CRISPR-associated helicase Cas3 [Pasteurella atlantica]
MLVTFISQCEKKALSRTRRILDAFANRIGDNVWQTAITEEGLLAVKQLLRQTASKSTAVSCHRVRTRQRTELIWIVGNKRKFNHLGIVAVNRTKRNILHNEWENDWKYASSIQIIATIAALLHDIGKTTLGFQDKLEKGSLQSDPYRHEWISLKLFEVMVEGCETDEQWLSRFTEIDKWLSKNKSTLNKRLQQCHRDTTQLGQIPPLAQWVAWLIISHHRFPPYNKKIHLSSKDREEFRSEDKKINLTVSLERYYQKYLSAFEGWVKTEEEKPRKDKTKKEEPKKISIKQQNSFWKFKEQVMCSPVWQKAIKRWSNKALKALTLMQLSQQAIDNKKAIDDTFLLYLSRLCLMVADHNYSSLGEKDKDRRFSGDENFKMLVANTQRIWVEDEPISKPNQTLDEHLIGVAALTAGFARKLPIIATALPTLKEQQSLSKFTDISRFKWQNKAYQLAQRVQKESEERGFFGVNMASTGCGKTIANARIMYGLADPKKGARFTIALGLRVLTLQTGQSFRKDLDLSAEKLAILVGGQASKDLFELNQQNNSQDKKEDEKDGLLGSESSEDLLSEWVDSQIDYQDYAELNLGTVIENKKVRDLLFSPVVTCTVDHIIQASECKRGGRYIAPMLRLLSSDLILDEPDDFDQNDLPALSRLVHLAGLFGSRVLLSSATLTPDLLMGLFQAYQAGRELFNHSQNKGKPNIVCAWFDEQKNTMKTVQCSNINVFTKENQQFIEKRKDFLSKQKVRRKADILPLDLSYNQERPARFYANLGQQILNGAIHLHNNYHQVDPQTDKKVSIGLVRIANINNIIPIAIQLFAKAEVPEDVHIHLSCYHSKKLLVLRNALETKLDRILHRDKENPSALFEHLEIRNALKQSQAKHHIFIILATPVAEVGRDHDYDWAIVEPSSMRSIIQLAGRIWRHRPDKVAEKTNMLILQYNIRYFKNPNSTIFTYPGFETKQFKPTSYNLQELLTTEQLAQIDAKPRIIKSTNDDIKTLSDLEHQVMQNLLNNNSLNYVNAYWNKQTTANRAHIHLQLISPFRAGKFEEDFLIIPNNESEEGYEVYFAESVYKNGLSNATLQDNIISPLEADFSHPQISPWLATGLVKALEEIQNSYPDKSLRYLATRFSSVSLDDRKEWRFSEFLGVVGY